MCQRLKIDVCSLKMEKVNMEKKKYISPVLEIVEIGTLHLLALSKESDEQIDDEEQMSNEYRGGGDWSDMWKNM